MAVFKYAGADEEQKIVEQLLGKVPNIAKAMTRAGAEVVAQNAKAKAPSELKKHIKVSRTYETPSDGGINTKVYVSGYIPFSNPSRTSFTRRNKAGGRKYAANAGVPAEFLAIVTEYGTSARYTEAGAYRGRITKKPFFRASFNKGQIESAMRRAQKTASGGILDE